MLRNTKKLSEFTKRQILINNLHPALKLPLTFNTVKSVVSEVMQGEDCAFNEIILNFVEDKEIKRINNKYLSHNFFTDIITFPYNSNPKNIEGEIFISLDTVKKNAVYYDTSYKEEFKRVIIHGCLHLTGWLDKTKKQKELIREKENSYLSEIL